MALSAKSLAGPGYVILNVLRAMNIIGLLAVMAASVVMIVKTTIVSKFFLFDAVSHVVVIGISAFLIASELSMFYPYFARNWPLLSVEHGFVGLGTTMFVLGVEVLGTLNKPASTKETLGTAFWRIVAGAGLIVIVLGGLNLIASYIFRSPALGITARHVRMDGAIALTTGPRTPVVAAYSANSLKSPYPPMTSPYTSPNKSLSVCTSLPFHCNNSTSDDESPKSSSSWWRLSSFKSLVTPIKQASKAILPLFHDVQRDAEQNGQHKKGKAIQKKVDIVSISGPTTVNPQFAHLAKPAAAAQAGSR